MHHDQRLHQRRRRRHLIGGGGGGIAALGADLALWFDNNQAYKSSGGGIVTPASMLTVARASAGSYFDNAGVLRQAANNALRLSYDPLTLTPRGALVEAAATNLLLYSEQFGNAAYNQANVAVAANQAIAPDGTTTADLITATSTNACRVHQLFTIASGTVITLSCFFKAGTANAAISYSNAGGANIAYGKFTLSGAGSVTINGGATVATITRLANDWYYCTLTLTTGVANGAAAFGPWDGTADQFSYPGSTSGATVYAWGAQAEANAMATSYIPTAGAQASRVADSITLATSAFPYNATEGTLVLHQTPAVEANAGLYRSIASLLNAGATNAILIRRNLPTLTTMLHNGNVIDTTTQVDIIASAIAIGEMRSALAYKANDFAASMNGAAAITDVSGTVPSDISVLSITGGAFSNGSSHIRRLAYYGSRKSDAQLQALSA